MSADESLIKRIKAKYTLNMFVETCVDGILTYEACKYVNRYIPAKFRLVTPFVLLPAINTVRTEILPITDF